MYTFNILGNCVCRDSIQPLISSGEARVLQYVLFCGSISMLSEKPDIRITEDIFNDMNLNEFE